uniref:Uncharacterized protein n=1 Tax=Anguilla anguilla TaxID=7936 RepID=A0A0E9SUD9_ANGAN
MRKGHIRTWKLDGLAVNNQIGKLLCDLPVLLLVP